MLITIRSLLDNSPYKHEPNQRDNPSFNQYVQYASWKCLLLDYFNKERNPTASEFLQKHITKNGVNIISEIQQQAKANPGSKHLTSPYSQTTKVNYESTLHDVIKLVEQCRTLEQRRLAILAPPPENTGDLVLSMPSADIPSIAPVTSPPPRSAEVVGSSPLKRKYAVVDLT